MRRAICPGSFDPVTNGHLDIFERASQMFDEIIISVFHNPGKDKAMFTMEERVEMLRDATKHIPNARVTCFSGLLNEFCRQEKAPFIVRGLRAFSDFEYEFQRALLIKKIDNNLETVFIMTNANYSFLSSSGIRELATFGGFLFGFIPAVYGIFSILREIIGLGIYWFVGSFILWKLLSVLLEREFDFKQVLMGTAYVEGYTGALGLALILVSIICIYITPFLMILLVPLALAYVGAVIYVAVMLLSRIMNVEPLTVGAVYVVLYIINLLYNWIMRILFA